MSPEEIKKIREELKRIPKEWAVTHSGEESDECYGPFFTLSTNSYDYTIYVDEQDEDPYLEFFAKSPSRIASLLDEVERLSKENEALKGKIDLSEECLEGAYYEIERRAGVTLQEMIQRIRKGDYTEETDFSLVADAAERSIKLEAENKALDLRFKHIMFLNTELEAENKMLREALERHHWHWHGRRKHWAGLGVKCEECESYYQHGGNWGEGCPYCKSRNVLEKLK